MDKTESFQHAFDQLSSTDLLPLHYDYVALCLHNYRKINGYSFEVLTNQMAVIINECQPSNKIELDYRSIESFISDRKNSSKRPRLIKYYIAFLCCENFLNMEWMVKLATDRKLLLANASGILSFFYKEKSFPEKLNFNLHEEYVSRNTSTAFQDRRIITFLKSGLENLRYFEERRSIHYRKAQENRCMLYEGFACIYDESSILVFSRYAEPSLACAGIRNFSFYLFREYHPDANSIQFYEYFKNPSDYNSPRHIVDSVKFRRPSLIHIIKDDKFLDNRNTSESDAKTEDRFLRAELSKENVHLRTSAFSWSSGLLHKNDIGHKLLNILADGSPDDLEEILNHPDVDINYTHENGFTCPVLVVASTGCTWAFDKLNSFSDQSLDLLVYNQDGFLPSDIAMMYGQSYELSEKLLIMQKQQANARGLNYEEVAKKHLTTQFSAPNL